MRSAIYILAMFVSAAMIACGVFLPLASVPVYGEVTYVRIAAAQSGLLISCSLAGPALLLTGQRSRVWLAALGVWAILLFPMIKSRVMPDRPGAVEVVLDSVTGPARDLATDLILHVTEIRWGGIVLVGGCVLFTVACIRLSLKR